MLFLHLTQRGLDQQVGGFDLVHGGEGQYLPAWDGCSKTACCAVVRAQTTAWTLRCPAT